MASQIQPLLAQEHLSDEKLLFNAYRIRIFEANSIPVLGDCHCLRDHTIVLIDLPDAEPELLDDSADKENVIMAVTPTKLKGEDEEVSLAGSPLQFEFLTLAKLRETEPEIQVTFRRISSSEFPLNPLPSGKAFALRQILYNAMRSRSLFAADVKLGKRVESQPAVFVACDASDNMRSLFLGFAENKKTISTYLTVCTGGLDEPGRFNFEKQLNRFPSNWEARARTRIVHTMMNEGNAAAVSEAGYAGCAIISIEYPSKPDVISADAPPSGAQAVVRFAPGWMDKRVPFYDKTEELAFMLSMARALKENGAVVWPEKEKLSEAEMMKAIRQLIQDSKDIKKNSSTRFLDFTERLWMILKECNSYARLVSAFRVVFDALRNGQIHASLHEDNRSQLARLIDESCKGKLLHLPRLEGLTPVELLLQIAVERFRRDTLYMFANEGFVAAEQDMETWMQKATASHSINSEDEAFTLLPLHLALQTMAFFCKYLDIPKHQLFQYTKDVLKKYAASPVSDIRQVHHELKVPVIWVHASILTGQQAAQFLTETAYTVAGGDCQANTSLFVARTPPLKALEKWAAKSEEGEENCVVMMTTASHTHKKDVSTAILEAA